MSGLVIEVRNRTRFDSKPIARVLRACCKHHSIRIYVRLYLRSGRAGYAGQCMQTQTLSTISNLRCQLRATASVP